MSEETGSTVNNILGGIGIHDEFPQSFISEFWNTLRENAAKKRVPLHGHFELTPLCTLDCKMCYVHLTQQQLQRKVLSFEEWKLIFDQAIGNGMLFATLSGGECLLSPIFDDVYLYLKSKGIFVFVFTNGVLLDTKMELFKQNKPALVQVSVYGWDEDSYETVTGHRCFARVTKAIQVAVKNGINISIAITPSKYLTDITKIVKAYATTNISITVNSSLLMPRESTGRNIDDYALTAGEQVKIAMDFQHIVQQKKLIPYTGQLPATNTLPSKMVTKGLMCAAGRTGFAITWEGRMTPCVSFDKASFSLTDGFMCAWKKCVAFADDFTYPVECGDCVYVKTCRFCPAHHLVTSDGTHCNCEICKETQLMVQYGLKNII